MRLGADRKLLIAVIVAVVAMLGIMAVNADRAYAGEYSGTVYFNLSHDGKPVMSDVTGDPMMMVPVDLQAVADVNLVDWGYEKYAYREYGGDETPDPDRPTVLKLYLYMHEQYKDDPQSSITVTQEPFSVYMARFWGFDENLNYYVNGAYPLYYEGEGATCDAIALEDGDRVDVMHFSDWSFWTDSLAGFNFFADANSDPEDGAIVESYDATVGDPLPIQVIRGYGSLMIGGATEYQAADDLTIHVSGKNSPIDLDDEEVGTLDGGTTEVIFDEPGRYYIWAEGGLGELNGTPVQSAAAAMVDVTAGENRKPKLATGVSATENKSINPSQNYSEDLSKIFIDPDRDPLTYKVSVDGGDYAACDKDYVYTPTGEGAITLKFKANDGQVDSDDTYTVNLTVSKDVLVQVEGLKIIDDQCREWPIYALADYETTAEYDAIENYHSNYYPIYKLTLPSAMDFTIIEDPEVFSVPDPSWLNRSIVSLKNYDYVLDRNDYETEEETHVLPVKADTYRRTEWGGNQFFNTVQYDLESLGYPADKKVVSLEVYGAWTERMKNVDSVDTYHILIDFDSSAQPSGSSHDLTKTDQVDATCTTDGAKAYWTCSKCHKLFADANAKLQIDAPETIPASHDWDEPTYVWIDDYKKATATHVCKRDPGHTESEEVDSEYYTGKNPTCLEKGKTVYTAKFEDKAFKTQTATVEDIPIDPDAHKWNDGEITTEPSCTAEGEKIFTCVHDANHTRKESVDRLPHTIGEVSALAATCTEDGHAAHYKCSGCNTLFADVNGENTITADNVKIPATDHAWGEWTVTREATEEAEGEETRICGHDDSHTETRAIPKLDPAGEIIKTVTVNVKTVNKKAVDNAVKKAGGTTKTVTTIVLGKKVKNIKKGTFKTYKNVKTLEVKTKKLKKKTVKGSLKGSAVKTIKVKVGSKKTNKKYVKKYKKIFTKKNAGKKVRITR